MHILHDSLFSKGKTIAQITFCIFFVDWIYPIQFQIIRINPSFQRKAEALFDPKTAGEGGRGGARQLSISKTVSSEERVKPCIFVTFNIIINHIFPENVI